jgi:hypothetical protein
MNITKLIFLSLLHSPVLAVLNVASLSSCHKQPLKEDSNQSEVKVTNSMVLGDFDYLPVVRLGNNCTATLIRENLLITTANCAQNNNSFTDHNDRDRPILAKAIPLFYKASDPLSQFNFGLLQIDPYMNSATVGGNIATTIDVASVLPTIDFDLVGFGCRDQAEPNIRGLKRKGRNFFVKPTGTGDGILTAQGTGMTTMDHTARYPNSMGCLGDEGAPALVNNRIAGIYLGERPIYGKKSKEAVFIDLTLKPVRDFIDAQASRSRCPGSRIR